MTEYKRKWRNNGVSSVEHRIIMERHIGRKLSDIEVVHHINGNKRDNRIENLQLLPDRATHNRIHALDFCPKGHEFTKENTEIRTTKSGGKTRRCKKCHRIETRKNYLSKKGIAEKNIDK